METIKKLDEILNLLCTKKIGDIHVESLMNEYVSEEAAAKNLNISTQVLRYFLTLLEEDKYVIIIPYEGEGSIKKCFITIKGRFFKESGGYSQVEKDKYNERILKLIEKVVLVFGAGAAGLYYLYQLYYAIFHALFTNYCCYH